MMTQSVWTPKSWRDRPIRQAPAYPDAARLEAAERKLGKYPPLVFAGEARRLKASLAEAASGRRLRPARRGLCRELRRFHRQHPARHVPRAAADGGRADLRRQRAGGEDGPHGRAVRETPQRRYRDAGRDQLAKLSRRYRQWPGVHRRGAHSRPEPHGARLLPGGEQAQPAARLRLRRLRRPARGASLESGLR